MAKQINLDKAELVEIVGSGLILEVSKDHMDRLLVRVESEEGGGRIIIKQHEEDARCIVYSLDTTPQKPTLTVVK